MEHKEALVNETSDSPHFGDENTLRGAKPVVPLAEIRGNKIRHTLLLTFALLIALGLGAGVAVVLDHLRQPKSVQASSTPEPANASNVEDPTLAAVGEEEEMMDLPSNESVADEPIADDQDSRTKTWRKRVERIRHSDRVVGISSSGNARIRNSDVEGIRNSDDDTQALSSQKSVNANASDSPRQPILVDQWEEKRSRRVAPNQRVTPNQRANANARPDLFRIRDIFEGARRH